MARILSLEELQSTTAPVYVETYYMFGNAIMSELVKTVRYDWPDTDTEFWTGFACGNQPRDEYNHTWRAWADRPTDRQRTETRPDWIRSDYTLRLCETSE